MGADDKSEDGSKKDVWERFGFPAAPSYEDKLANSRVTKTVDVIESLDGEKRRKVYMVATVVILVLAVLCFILALIFINSGSSNVVKEQSPTETVEATQSQETSTSSKSDTTAQKTDKSVYADSSQLKEVVKDGYSAYDSSDSTEPEVDVDGYTQESLQTNALRGSEAVSASDTKAFENLLTADVAKLFPDNFKKYCEQENLNLNNNSIAVIKGSSIMTTETMSFVARALTNDGEAFYTDVVYDFSDKSFTYTPR